MKKLQNFIPLIGLLSAGQLAYAEEQAVQLEKMEIVGVTPLQGSGIGIDKVPVPVQKITADQLEQSQSLSLADYMNRYMGSVNINDAQNNPFQPDVQ